MIALLAMVSVVVVQPVVPVSPASSATRKTVTKKTVTKTVTKKATTKTTVRKVPARKTTQFGSNRTGSTPMGVVEGPYAEFVRRVGVDLDRFWGAELPGTYRQSFNGLTGFFPYSSAVLPPDCGRVRVPSYEVVAGNAFYCRESDYIAFDNEALFPEVYDQFGASALGVILAHEYGHAMQARTATSLNGALNEMQADCFSGAWLRRVTTGGSPTVSVPAADLDTILQAVLTFRDTPGTGATTVGAHGTGFDRVTGLQLGYDFGTARCAAFTKNPPVVVAKRFVGLEQANQGNVPYADAVEIANRTTDQYFRSTYPELGAGAVVTPTDPGVVAAVPSTCTGGVTIFGGLLGICPGDPATPTSIVYPADRMSRVYDLFGDSAVGYVYALGWSTLVALRQGRETPGASTAAENRTICGAAGWYRWFGVGTTETLSSGDLDEGILVALGVQGAAPAFDRVRALRQGYERGPAGCA